MKKLMKSEICESINSAWDPHVAKNWLKSQTFWQKNLKRKKKKSRNANVHLESTFCTSQMHPTSTTPVGGGVAIMPLP